MTSQDSTIRFRVSAQFTPSMAASVGSDPGPTPSIVLPIDK